MSLGPRPTDSVMPSRGLTRRLAWLFRWLLVLLLAVDIAGTPLHRHHHDSGVDSSSIHGQLADSLHSAHHVEGDDHDPDFVHAVTTVRAESRASASDMAANTDSRNAPLVATWALPWRDTEAIGRPYRTDPDTPLHRLHRSLPPAGRAPPVRA